MAVDAFVYGSREGAAVNSGHNSNKPLATTACLRSGTDIRRAFVAGFRGEKWVALRWRIEGGMEYM
ncbi:hypothetical protein E4U44_003117 [Claviceps purpurea]|nr:hypothetical protein E4U44_003117 [Claviceps purpurea]